MNEITRNPAHKAYDENDNNPQRPDGLFWWVEFSFPGVYERVIVKARTRTEANTIADRVEAGLKGETHE